MKRKHNYNMIKLPKETMETIKEEVAKNGGLYIEGLCMIRTVRERKPKNVDGLFKKGTSEEVDTIKIYTQRNFSNNVKRYKKTKK